MNQNDIIYVTDKNNPRIISDVAVVRNYRPLEYLLIAKYLLHAKRFTNKIQRQKPLTFRFN